jgi:hypothetical protein
MLWIKADYIQEESNHARMLFIYEIRKAVFTTRPPASRSPARIFIIYNFFSFLFLIIFFGVIYRPILSIAEVHHVSVNRSYTLVLFFYYYYWVATFLIFCVSCKVDVYSPVPG